MRKSVVGLLVVLAALVALPTLAPAQDPTPAPTANSALAAFRNAARTSVSEEDRIHALLVDMVRPSTLQKRSRSDSNTCPYANDGECDEPGIGTGACSAGSDTNDCIGPALNVGGNACVYANDGECDEPGIGTGACARGADYNDCYGTRAGPNSCPFRGDGVCDEPGIGTGRCGLGTDGTDCTANSCQYAFDGECDEPGIGTGACAAGTDTADCS